jgi:S-phase kinase-associated protein 1
MAAVQLVTREGVEWDKYIVLQSNDQPPQEYKVLREAAKMSALIKEMLDDQAAESETVVPVPNVAGNTLKYVIQWVEHHYNLDTKSVDKPLRGKIEEVVGEFDRTFLFTDLVKNANPDEHDLLIDVMMAANFLNIKVLLDMCCACLASMIKNKTSQEIRDFLGIENDFTPEEEAKMAEEHKWVLES